jgi:hypothetical protein
VKNISESTSMIEEVQEIQLTQMPQAKDELEVHRR